MVPGRCAYTDDQSNVATSDTVEMLFPVRRIQVHVPSGDGHFDRSIVNTVTGFQNRDRAMLPIPTLEYTAGKCKRACYAHFKHLAI
jgi:hypothetical protein